MNNLLLMDLFDHVMNERLSAEALLVVRLRQHSLAEFVGQEEIIAPASS